MTIISVLACQSREDRTAITDFLRSFNGLIFAEKHFISKLENGMDGGGYKMRYRHYLVRVNCVFDGAKSLWKPVVEISWSADEGTDVQLLTGKSFVRENEAEEAGLEMGMDWIDEFLVTVPVIAPPKPALELRALRRRSCLLQSRSTY